MACIDWNKRQLKNILGFKGDGELQNREHVTEIHLCFNFITEVPPGSFSGCTALTCLSLNCNNLTAIPLLEGTPTLRELHLDSNQISVMEHLQFVPNLECLNLRCNRIRTIDNLLENSSLQSLSLSGNPISSLSWDQIPYFKKLKFLGLYGSKISSFDNILKLLSRTPALAKVYLGCSTFSDGRPLTLSSVLLSAKHIEVEEMTQLLSQLKECVQCSKGDENWRMLTSEAAGRVCGGYAPQSGHALMFVASILTRLKETCPPLVTVDGERIFCAR